MSTGYSGVRATVHVGASDADAMGWSADVEANEWDSTTTGDAGWDDTSTSTNKVSGSFDILYNKAKKPFGTLGLTQGTIINPLHLYFNEDDSEGMFGKAVVLKVSTKAKTREGIILTVTWKNKGPWTLPS